MAAGTGKTLVARALAASASRAGRKVAFFMRKGADILSKWVGEAERQLRLLFEEAQRQQPAIIFFDEIDGLAPVRRPRTCVHLTSAVLCSIDSKIYAFSQASTVPAALHYIFRRDQRPRSGAPSPHPHALYSCSLV